jgi:hypothetical protein
MSGELDRTRMHLEDSLSERNEMQTEILRLQDGLGGVSSRASHLKDELVRATRGTREVMRVLQVHQTQKGSAPKLGSRQDESVDSVDGTVLGTPPVSIRVDASCPHITVGAVGEHLARKYQSYLVMSLTFSKTLCL